MFNRLLSGEVLEFNGENSGKTSIILVGVHGNEVCGVEAMRQILPDFSIYNGRVLIAIGNPKAVKNNERQGKANLNRMFVPNEMIPGNQRRSYEYKRAQFLKPFLNQADALLDVHASTADSSVPFIICERNAKYITDYLPFEKVVYGFDNVEPGGTDYYMNSVGKVGICAECGPYKEKSSWDAAMESIFTFLKIQGHIPGEVKKYKHKLIQMYDLYKNKTSKFKLNKKFDDFEIVRANQVIAQDGDKEIKCEKDSIILFAKDSKAIKGLRQSLPIGDEAFLLGEYI